MSLLFVHFSDEVKFPITAGTESLGSLIQTGMTNFGMTKPEQMSLVLPLPVPPPLPITGSYCIPASLGTEIHE